MQYSPKLTFSYLILMLLTHIELSIALSCRLKSSTLCFGSSLFWTCSLLTWSDFVPPYPCKEARHTFRVACQPGGSGTAGPGDSRLTSGPPTRALELYWCSLFSLRLPCWGCSRFGGVGLLRPEGHAHLEAVQGKHQNTFQGQGRTDMSLARD